MTYVFAGIIASSLMLFYNRPPARTSPIHRLPNSYMLLNCRLGFDNRAVLSHFSILISFSILFAVAGLRYGIGTDYHPRLIPVFEKIREGYDADYETGFTLLNKLVSVLSDDGQWLVALVSFVTIFLVYRFILRMSLNPALSVFVFFFGGFYLEVFNLAQQGLAIAILLNTIELVLRGKHLSFLLITLIAVSIHSSAIVWLLVWPVLLFFHKKWHLIMLLIFLAVIVLIFPDRILEVVTTFSPDYSWYLDSNYSSARSIDLSVMFVAFLLFASSLIQVIRFPIVDRYLAILVNLQMLGIAALLGAVTTAYFFARIGYFFTPIQIIALPAIISLVKSKTLRLCITTIFIILYLFSFYQQFILWNAHGVMPYESVL